MTRPTSPAPLKIDFHTHTSEDPKDTIDYDARRLIDRAAELGYDALAITNHYVVAHTPALESYAGRLGILLLPGVELTLSGKHVLVINPGFRRNPGAGTFEDLARISGPDTLIVAPHPFFYGFKSLQRDLFALIRRFDAIEFSSFYNHRVDMNRKGLAAAAAARKPVIGSSDCHNIWQFGGTYSLVEAAQDPRAIVQAVKAGQVAVRSSPLSLPTMFRIGVNFLLTDRLKLRRRI